MALLPSSLYNTALPPCGGMGIPRQPAASRTAGGLVQEEAGGVGDQLHRNGQTLAALRAQAAHARGADQVEQLQTWFAEMASSRWGKECIGIALDESNWTRLD